MFKSGSKIQIVALAVVLSGAACGPNSGRCVGLSCARDGGGGDAGDASVNHDGPVGNVDLGLVVLDPQTCTEAAANHSYIGCDYWPTVLPNIVWSTFDFAVVVSNPGTQTAMVTVTGPSSTNQQVAVPPNQLVQIYLPWVPELKGPDMNECGVAANITASVTKTGGAYHLVSSVPVIVYQFSALEYKGQGGPSGKDWSQCPGTIKGCSAAPWNGMPVGCFSFTNDASLLLPSTAMTGHYRVASHHGIDGNPGVWPFIPPTPGQPGYFAVTATQDGTQVTIKAAAKVLAGGSITAIAAGQTESFNLNAGDVALVVAEGAAANDLSGSQVQATKPVQVIGGAPCMQNPLGHLACDHLETLNMPAETLGKHYVVTVPTGPNGTPVGHSVRIIGNVDGTTLTYSSAPAGAPAGLSAGQVVVLSNVTQDFEVRGDHEFIVSTVMLSATDVDPMHMGASQKGDPSLSTAIAVEQYRQKYVFLAPADYDVNYVDIVAPTGASLILDGAPVTQTPGVVGSFGVLRVPITPGAAMGAHVLTADQPFSLQVIGYGSFTSYQVPGGLNLLSIAPPPPPIM